jgi:hypothetical protein
VVQLHKLFEPHVSYEYSSWILNQTHSAYRNGNHPTDVGLYQMALAYKNMLETPVYNKHVALFGDSITSALYYPQEKRPDAILAKMLSVTAAHSWSLYQ